jgi:hypothetical protein
MVVKCWSVGGSEVTVGVGSCGGMTGVLWARGLVGGCWGRIACVVALRFVLLTREVVVVVVVVVSAGGGEELLLALGLC